VYHMLKALIVVLSVSLVCSFVVTSTAVILEERQRRNQYLERISHILEVVGIEGEQGVLPAHYRERFDSALIDLSLGEKVDPAGFPEFLHPDNFDFVAAARYPESSEKIADSPIGLKFRPRYMPVYFLRSADGLEQIILLIAGKGLWSTLQGYLALERDLTTIAGIRFFQHGETPGLGAEIANPRWQVLWRGKQAFDADGRVVIEVVKGPVDPASPNRIEGLSGATLTTRGVNQLVRYWLGPEGYGPFLAVLREQTGRRQ